MEREIVVNGRFLSRPITGVERYGREIIQLLSGSYRLEKTRMNGAPGHLWEQFMLPMKLKSKSVLWSPANTGPLMVRSQALTVHDLSPLDHPDWFKKSFAAWYRLFMPMLIKKVRVVFTPSDYVKQKIKARFGMRNVIVTPNSMDTNRFYPGAKQTTYELPDTYIFFVGSLQLGKNLHGLLQAWHEVKDEYPNLWLVIAGGTGSVFGKIDLSAEERVRFLGYVSENDLPGLYAKATLFVLPSFDEGFGLPALEAMACGTPVIVSNGGALPETVGDAGMIFNLSDTNGLSTAMEECLNNEALRSKMIEKGYEHIINFSWQKSAGLIWNTLNEI